MELNMGVDKIHFNCLVWDDNSLAMAAAALSDAIIAYSLKLTELQEQTPSAVALLVVWSHQQYDSPQVFGQFRSIPQ